MARAWFGVVVALTMGVSAGIARADEARLQTLRARLEAVRTRAPAQVPEGVFPSIEHLLDVSERIRKGFPAQAVEWEQRARAYLDAVEKGEDPYPRERGRIVSRGYRSPISLRVQGYTVYVPPDYTPDQSWPLMIVLHGGSSNGNLFLGVVLGNNMNWKEYDKYLWDRYEPRWSPPWIVAAPDGYGQVLWRWMGEQDVLDVIDDISRHYNVDSNRVVLSGLSNGGVGAYAIGSRHASRFSAVQAIAGAPSWLQYSGEAGVQEVEAKLMRPWSAMELLDNWRNTDFRYYHGNVDPGPMRPAYVHALDERVEKLGIPHRGKWYEAGHDLLYLVHRHGKVYDELTSLRRQQQPAEVHLVTGDYRAARQHWLEVTRIERYPDLARVVGKVNGAKLELTTQNVRAFAVDLRELPATGAEIEITVDGVGVHRGKRAELGQRVHLARETTWRLGFPREQGMVKRPGMSGPLTDAYYGRMVHVYGTQRPEHAKALKELAHKGARGWPLWLWTVEQEVVADSEVTAELARDAHLVLYGTPGDNLLLDRLMPKLPIRVEGAAVVAGEKRFESKGVGARFIYPNPESPERYVTVFAAPTLDGVRRGHNLPDFVPDYVVYDAVSAAQRPRLTPAKPPLLRGFFDGGWQLPPP
jgi:hypothetical protein